MDSRTRILHAAADLLARSADADVSTRAVTKAAGVSAPILYRQFGDKEGLLTAVVDYGFEQYLSSKRALAPSDDPVQDLRDGWDNHVLFARENQNYYRLMYSPGLSAPPAAAQAAQDLLREAVERVALAGRLCASVETATQMIMSANVGVALSLITRPAQFPDPGFSAKVRDAVLGSATVPLVPETEAASVAPVAALLAVLLRAERPTGLTGPETALLDQWLSVLADQ